MQLLVKLVGVLLQRHCAGLEYTGNISRIRCDFFRHPTNNIYYCVRLCLCIVTHQWSVSYTAILKNRLTCSVCLVGTFGLDYIFMVLFLWFIVSCRTDSLPKAPYAKWSNTMRDRVLTNGCGFLLAKNKCLPAEGNFPPPPITDVYEICLGAGSVLLY